MLRYDIYREAITPHTLLRHLSNTDRTVWGVGGWGEPVHQSSFRAVSEQFQSDFRAVSEQFQYIYKTERTVSEQFQSSFRAVSEQ